MVNVTLKWPLTTDEHRASTSWQYPSELSEGGLGYAQTRDRPGVVQRFWLWRDEAMVDEPWLVKGWFEVNWWLVKVDKGWLMVKLWLILADDGW